LIIGLYEYDLPNTTPVVRPEMNLTRIFGGLFGNSKKGYCSFCGKHHSVVAKLIDGGSCSICNECVLICSNVLMKECEEYRKSQIEKVGDLLAGASGTKLPPVPLAKEQK
jgi:ClpX C4-type zinc finger